MPCVLLLCAYVRIGALLPLGYKFAKLSEETKQKYVHEKSFYSFGWSHGMCDCHKLLLC